MIFDDGTTDELGLGCHPTPSHNIGRLTPVTVTGTSDKQQIPMTDTSDIFREQIPVTDTSDIYQRQIQVADHRQ